LTGIVSATPGVSKGAIDRWLDAQTKKSDAEAGPWNGDASEEHAQA
jgi:hypothetical protein